MAKGSPKGEEAPKVTPHIVSNTTHMPARVPSHKPNQPQDQHLQRPVSSQDTSRAPHMLTKNGKSLYKQMKKIKAM